MPALIDRADTRSRPPSGRTIVGTLLVTWAVQLVVAAVFGVSITLWVFVAGGLILQRWFVGRSHGALLVGGLMVGVGLAAIVVDLVPGTGLDSFFRLIGWAFGFLLVASLGGRATRWSYAVAAVFGVAALSALGLAVGRLPSGAASVAFPLILLVAGLLLLSGGRGRPKLLLVVMGLGLLLVASSVSDSYRGIRGESSPRARTRVALPALAGRTLVVETDGSVRVTVGTVPEAVVAGGGRRSAIPEVDDREVRFDGGDVDAFDLVVPAGTDVVVRGGDQVIAVEGRGGRTEIEADDAHVTLSGWFDDLAVTIDDGRVEGELAFAGSGRRAALEVDDGRAHLRYSGRPRIEAEVDDGRIEVDGTVARGSFTREGGQGVLRLRGDDGVLVVSARPLG